MYILGISAFYHDSAACIVGDGKIITAAQEERFTRKKHDHQFPKRAIEYCLQEAGITSKQIDQVAFYDKPWLKFERILETYLTYVSSGISSFLKAMPLWLKQKLWMDDLIKKEINFDQDIIYKEKIFDKIWIQPAAGDAGGALGAALFTWYQVLGKTRAPSETKDSQKGSYLGPSFNGDKIESWLKQKKYPYHKVADEKIGEQTAKLIAEDKIVW